MAEDTWWLRRTSGERAPVKGMARGFRESEIWMTYSNTEIIHESGIQVVYFFSCFLNSFASFSTCCHSYLGNEELGRVIVVK